MVRCCPSQNVEQNPLKYGKATENIKLFVGDEYIEYILCVIKGRTVDCRTGGQPVKVTQRGFS
jgi:hypothetical protein